MKVGSFELWIRLRTNDVSKKEMSSRLENEVGRVVDSFGTSKDNKKSRYGANPTCRS